MKKITNLLLASALSLTALVGTTSAASFNDVPSSHWACSFVDASVNANLMGGTGDKEFAPDKTMTYGEFAVVVVNGALDGKNTGDKGPHWADLYLNTLISHGYLKTSTGADVVAQTSGWQDQAITREDAASILVRVMGKANASGKVSIQVAHGEVAVDAFADVGFAQEANGQALDIAVVMANDVMIGSNGSFGVGTSMKRCEAAVVFQSLLEMNVFQSSEKKEDSSSDTTTTTTPSTTTPSTGTTTPSTSTATKPADVVLGSGQYNTGVFDVPADTNEDGWLTNAEVKAVIDRLQAEYPSGTPWDSDKYYKAHVSFSTDIGNVRRGYGCAAWAFFVSDEIFGNLPSRRVVGDLSLDPQEQIRPGDSSYSSAIVHWASVGYANSYGTMYLGSAGNTNGKVGWSTSSRYDVAQENLIKYVDILYVFTRYPEA